jgi:phosphoribosylglycinamide formyltransferase-1
MNSVSKGERHMANIRIGALISGGGSNLQAVMDACASGAIPGRVVFAGSDNPDAGGLLRAKTAGIPTFVTPYGQIIRKVRENAAGPMPSGIDLDAVLAKQALFHGEPDRDRVRRFLTARILAESDLLTHMAAFEFDLLILAGFMRTLSPFFIDQINGSRSLPRIMNIHPALLPSFPGVDGYGDTVRHGCKVGGCTVHFIDYGEDTGPIIGQRAFAIEPSDTLDDVKKKGLEQEWQLYPECIRLYAEERLSLVASGGKTVVHISTP